MKIPYYIVIEGLDGSGKRTTAEVLAKIVNTLNSVEVVSFPAYDKWHSFFVRKHLAKKDKTVESNPYLTSLAYAFDRWMWSIKHTFRWNKPDVVIFDRYVTSNMIYQCTKYVDGHKRTRLLRFIARLEYKLLRIPMQDITIVLGTNAEKSSDNVEARGRETDGYEAVEQQRKTQENMNHLIEALGWYRVETVNAETGEMYTPVQIATMIYSIVAAERAFNTPSFIHGVISSLGTGTMLTDDAELDYRRVTANVQLTMSYDNLETTQGVERHE